LGRFGVRVLLALVLERPSSEESTFAPRLSALSTVVDPAGLGDGGRCGADGAQTQLRVDVLLVFLIRVGLVLGTVGVPWVPTLEERHVVGVGVPL
jgi:hypothetical protein